MTSLNQAMELLREGKAIMEEMTIEGRKLRSQLATALEERDEWHERCRMYQCAMNNAAGGMGRHLEDAEEKE